MTSSSHSENNVHENIMRRHAAATGFLGRFLRACGRQTASRGARLGTVAGLRLSSAGNYCFSRALVGQPV